MLALDMTHGANKIGKYLIFFIKSEYFKGALSGLRQFVATENTLKVMENAFYFTLKALFILKIFTFLSWRFGHDVLVWLD